MTERTFQASPTSEGLFARARRVMPGGVNSPVRAFTAVDGTPLFMTGAAGSRLFISNGEELIDFCGSRRDSSAGP